MISCCIRIDARPEIRFASFYSIPGGIKMYEFLSHLLDPAAPHWPGTPAVAATQDTEIGDECPYASWTMTVPNHFGTHMDAPRHFVPGGIKITDLPIEYFTHDRVLFIDAEGVMPEDLKPYEEEIKKVSCLLIRTGYEKYRTEDPTRYETLSPHVHPETCKYLVETFPDLLVIGFDFLALGTPANDLAPVAHRQLLGFDPNQKKFVTCIEDMHLSALPAGCKIKRFYNLPLRVINVDSSVVTCVAEF